MVFWDTSWEMKIGQLQFCSSFCFFFLLFLAGSMPSFASFGLKRWIVSAGTKTDSFSISLLSSISMIVNPATLWMAGEDQSTCSYRGEAEGHVARCTCRSDEGREWKGNGLQLTLSNVFHHFQLPVSKHGPRSTQSWGCSCGWHSSRHWCCFLCTGVGSLFVMRIWDIMQWL